MPILHRPPPQPLPSSSSSSIPHPAHYHQQPTKLYALFANLTFHVLTAKVEADLAQIYACIDELGGRCVGVEEAGLVVSAVKGRPRLIRSLGKEWVDIKPIVTPQYVLDTYTRALEYAAEPLPDLHKPPSLPLRTKYLVSAGHLSRPIRPVPIANALKIKREGTLGSELSHDGLVKQEKEEVVVKQEKEEEEEEEQERNPKRRKLENGHTQTPNKQEPGIKLEPDTKPEVEGVVKQEEYWGEEMEEMKVFEPDVRFEDIPALCVHRGSPLICVNQDIIDAIRPIIEEREFEEAQQKNSNVLSYRRSLSILKSIPRRIKSGKEAKKLLGIGDKVVQRIDEYLQTGEVLDSANILASSRFQALKLFSSVYTIGNHKAKELYDRHYCRTLEDVRMHFEALEEESPEVRVKDKLRRRRRGRMKQVEIVEEWIRLKDELDQKIPREEVEEIAACVMEHLDAYVSGCNFTICGGFRRGKTESNDVDIVFAPPGMDMDIGLLRDLYLRLTELGIITHVLHVTQRDPLTPIHASPNNFDNLDKAFVIFKLPGPGRLHRRVDLISSPYDRYASAVLSWSGSMMFERDLKRYTENERGYKFRAGLVKVSTGEEVNLETERDIFSFLGLRYVPPELRNAD